MKKFNRLTALILLVLMVLSVLVSCGETNHAIPEEPAKQAKKASVIIEETDHGMITATKSGKVLLDDEVAVRLIPDEGYKVESFEVNGEDVTEDLIGDTYTFFVSGKTVISATFEADYCAVTGSVRTEGGKMTGLTVTLTSASGETYRATANATSGTYTAKVLPGTYTVTAVCNEYEEAQVGQMTVISDRTLDPVLLGSRLMGDSPLENGKATVDDAKTGVGAFTCAAGKYVSTLNSGVSTTYFKNFKASRYILQVDVGAAAADLNQFGSPMPGVILAQNDSLSTCLYFDLVKGKCGLAKVKTDNSLSKDPVTYDFDADAMKAGYITVTAVCDVTNLTVYLNGQELFTQTGTDYLNGKQSDAGYLASQVVAEYADPVLTEDMGQLSALLRTAQEKHEPPTTRREVDVIVIAGQSNCAGHTSLAYLKQKYPDLYAKYAGGFDNVYINYVANSHASFRFTNVRFGQGYVPNGQSNCRYGPEIGMAAYLSETYPDREFYIIKCGFSATGLYEKWASPSATVKGEAKEKFVAFEQHLNNSLEMLRSQGLDPRVLSFCWMQGENDAQAKWLAFYEGYEKALIEDVREMLQPISKGPTIAFVDAQISSEKKVDGTYVWTEQEGINGAKAAVRDTLPQYNFLFDPQAYGLTGKTESNDNDGFAHYDSKDCIELGKLFARFSMNLDG